MFRTFSIALAASFVLLPAVAGQGASASEHDQLVAKHAGPWELYDLSKDRVEGTDVAAKMPDKVKELTAKYTAWAKRALVEPWPVAPEK